MACAFAVPPCPPRNCKWSGSARSCRIRTDFSWRLRVLAEPRLRPIQMGAGAAENSDPQGRRCTSIHLIEFGKLTLKLCRVRFDSGQQAA